MQDVEEGFDAQEILPGLWLGSEKAFERLEPLQERGIGRVLIPANTGCQTILFPDNLTYLQYNISDVGDFPLLPLFPELFRFIAEGREHGGVLVACAQGKSRSAAVVIGYVMSTQAKRSFAEALHVVRSKRKVVSTKFEAQLKQFEKMEPEAEAGKRHPFTGKPLFSNWE